MVALLASAYRVVDRKEAADLQAWVEPLEVGASLPTLPLWITPDLALPLHLESTYLTACRSLRISA